MVLSSWDLGLKNPPPYYSLRYQTFIQNLVQNCQNIAKYNATRNSAQL